MEDDWRDWLNQEDREIDEFIAQHVERVPNVMVGKPVIKGTRITVQVILEVLATAGSTDKVIASYPRLTEADVQAAILFGARAASLRGLELAIPG